LSGVIAGKRDYNLWGEVAKRGRDAQWGKGEGKNMLNAKVNMTQEEEEYIIAGNALQRGGEQNPTGGGEGQQVTVCLGASNCTM